MIFHTYCLKDWLNNWGATDFEDFGLDRKFLLGLHKLIHATAWHRRCVLRLSSCWRPGWCNLSFGRLLVLVNDTIQVERWLWYAFSSLTVFVLTYPVNLIYERDSLDLWSNSLMCNNVWHTCRTDFLLLRVVLQDRSHLMIADSTRKSSNNGLYRALIHSIIDDIGFQNLSRWLRVFRWFVGRRQVTRVEQAWSLEHLLWGKHGLCLFPIPLIDKNIDLLRCLVRI